MPYIAWINEIFPPPQEPFSVAEMTRRLQQLYNPRINEDMVHGAIRALKKRPAMASRIAPIDGARPAFYDAEPARLIARYLTRCMEPERLKSLPKQNTSPSSHLRATVDATAPEMDIAA